MELFACTLDEKKGVTPPAAQSAHEATPERITDEIMAMPGTTRLLRLSRNPDNWLEIGWHKKGYVMREKYEGSLYYSDAPDPSAEETATQVAEYLKTSIADLDEWFQANGTDANYGFITDRGPFELLRKRYRLTTFVPRMIASVLLLLVVGATLVLLGIYGGPRIVLVVPVGLFFYKFDLRPKKKKGKWHYHASG